jgi:hypothetical protein
MQIEQQVKGDIAVIAITGDITLSKGGDVPDDRLFGSR